MTQEGKEAIKAFKHEYRDDLDLLGQLALYGLSSEEAAQLVFSQKEASQYISRVRESIKEYVHKSIQEVMAAMHVITLAKSSHPDLSQTLSKLAANSLLNDQFVIFETTIDPEVGSLSKQS